MVRIYSVCFALIAVPPLLIGCVAPPSQRLTVDPTATPVVILVVATPTPTVERTATATPTPSASPTPTLPANSFDSRLSKLKNSLDDDDDRRLALAEVTNGLVGDIRGASSQRECFYIAADILSFRSWATVTSDIVEPNGVKNVKIGADCSVFLLALAQLDSANTDKAAYFVNLNKPSSQEVLSSACERKLMNAVEMLKSLAPSTSGSIGRSY